MILIRYLFALNLALASAGALSVSAQAQSNCPYIADRAVLTAGQWNQCFANKQDSLGYIPVNKAGDVMLGKLTMQAASTAGAGLNLPQGTAPATPNNGDVWTTLTGMYVRINGATVGPLGAISAASFAGTAPIGVTRGPGFAEAINIVERLIDAAHALQSGQHPDLVGGAGAAARENESGVGGHVPMVATLGRLGSARLG